MANESRTGGRSRAARQAFTEGNGAGIDSDQAGGYGLAWRTCGALKTGAELLEGVAQDWRDVANEASDGGDMVRRLTLAEPRADVELLRALACALADTAGVHIEPSECGRTFDDAIGCVRARGHRGPCVGYRAGAWLEFFRVEPMPARACENCGRTLDAEGECRGGCSQGRDQDSGERCARLANHAGVHLAGAQAIEADRYDARWAPDVPAAPTFGAALKGWARDAIAAYRSTRSAADLADIAHNADPRD